jgi:hypothetical protein
LSATAVQTIKFFGWTSAWIDKVHKLRLAELAWMIRGLSKPFSERAISLTKRWHKQVWLNGFYLSLLWDLVSLFVPLAAFFCYVKLQKEALSVAIAFTVRFPTFCSGKLRRDITGCQALSLFNMCVDRLPGQRRC